MVARVKTVAFQGIDCREVDVEVQAAPGLPAFTVVGLPDKVVGESRERVRAVLRECKSWRCLVPYGIDITRLLQRLVSDQWEYWARCKRASVISDWVTGTPVEEIERRYTPNPYQGRVSYGDILRFADNARFHLRSAHQIILILIVDDRRLLDELDMLGGRGRHGLPPSRQCLD